MYLNLNWKSYFNSDLEISKVDVPEKIFDKSKLDWAKANVSLSLPSITQSDGFDKCFDEKKKFCKTWSLIAKISFDKFKLKKWICISSEWSIVRIEIWILMSLAWYTRIIIFMYLLLWCQDSVTLLLINMIYFMKTWNMIYTRKLPSDSSECLLKFLFWFLVLLFVISKSGHF